MKIKEIGLRLKKNAKKVFTKRVFLISIISLIMTPFILYLTRPRLVDNSFLNSIFTCIIFVVGYFIVGIIAGVVHIIITVIRSEEDEDKSARLAFDVIFGCYLGVFELSLIVSITKLVLKI